MLESDDDVDSTNKSLLQQTKTVIAEFLLNHLISGLVGLVDKWLCRRFESLIFLLLYL